MENEIENLDSVNEETTAEAETEEVTESTDEETDAAALKARLQDVEAKNKQLFARAKRAEGFEFNEETKRWYKPEKKAETVEKPKEQKVAPQSKTDGLDETQLDYLDLKGITEDEDIELIESVMKRTGQTLRQALKDDYVLTKLDANKKERDVKQATPKSTKRSGGVSANDVEYWLRKNEETGELPQDFELRRQVVAAKASRGDETVPPWRR